MKIIGTDLYSYGFESAVNDFLELLKGPPKNLLISASDANVLVLAKEDESFKKITGDYYSHFPDGMPSVWMLRLKGSKSATRVGGPDFFKRIINETVATDAKHFLCGGAEGVADSLKKTCEDWGNNQVVGTYCPPYKDLSEEEIKDIANIINESGATILWVGLGAPKQLYFAHRIVKYTKVHAILTIGAAFDFHTDRVKKAPSWIQRIGMEWFYRLTQEPRRLFKRYARVVPKFIYYNIVDKTY